MVSGQYCVQHACDQHQPEPVRCERWAPLSYRGCFRGVPCRLCVVLYDAASCRRGPSCARGGESSLERGLTTWGARGGQGPLCAGSSRTWHPEDMCGIITRIIARTSVRGTRETYVQYVSFLVLHIKYCILRSAPVCGLRGPLRRSQ